MNRSVMSDDEVVELLGRTMQRIADIAPGLPVVEPRVSRWPVTAAAAAITVAGVGGYVLLADRSDPAPATTGPAVSPPVPTDTAAPTGTVPGGDRTGGTPRWATGTEPAPFPSEIPLPDDVETVTPMEWDAVRVGWGFVGRRDPASGIERCTRYADAFDDTWRSTVDTDEHPSVRYARHFVNDHWDVGIYCIDDGDFLVQALNLDVTTTVPPASG